VVLTSRAGAYVVANIWELMIAGGYVVQTSLYLLLPHVLAHTTIARAFSEPARRIAAEGGEAYVRASDGSVRSMQELVEFYDKQIERLTRLVEELQQQLREKEDLIREQGRMIRNCNEHISQLERRRDWPRPE
jgi:peptidoglycan hydrolase CwlO-like protein